MMTQMRPKPQERPLTTLHASLRKDQHIAYSRSYLAETLNLGWLYKLHLRNQDTCVVSKATSKYWSSQRINLGTSS